MDVELPRRITMDVRSVIREMSPPRVTMKEVSPSRAGKEEPRGSPIRVTVREVSPPTMGEVSPPRGEASPPRGSQGTMPPLLISNPARWVHFYKIAHYHWLSVETQHHIQCQTKYFNSTHCIVLVGNFEELYGIYCNFSNYVSVQLV